MSLIESLKKILSSKKQTDEVPKEVCPQCWGRQEYEGQFYKAIYNKEKDLGWIQNYANTKLSPITLKKEGNEYVCPTCKVKYQVE